MEYFGLVAFVLVMAYSSYPSKVKKLEKKLIAIKRNGKGENTMSKLISDLKGSKCLIECEEVFFSDSTSVECDVIDCDDEWIKVRYKDKKGTEKVKIIRIENIESIELLF